MALPWALALIAFFGWVVSEAYKQGKKEGTKEGEAQAASPPQSEWNTYAGEIQTFVEHAGLAFYGCELTLKGQPRELLLARSYKRAFRALSDTFPDGIFEGKSIVYTVSMSKRFLNLCTLEGISSLGGWTGGPVPATGVHEKGGSFLALQHHNLFVPDYVRANLQEDPKYNERRFY